MSCVFRAGQERPRQRPARVLGDRRGLEERGLSGAPGALDDAVEERAVGVAVSRPVELGAQGFGQWAKAVRLFSEGQCVCLVKGNTLA